MAFEEAAEALSKVVDSSVAATVRGESKVAVAFSGGLDSSFLAKCAMRHSNVVACTAYSEGAADSTRARDSASALGLEIVVTRLTAENVASELKGIVLPFVPSLMDRALWCLYSLVAKSARDSGARVLILGQLADELFGGYAKYVGVLQEEGEGATRSMMDQDLRDYARRGRLRDFGACERWVQPRLPYEAHEVVDFAASLPLSFKIRQGSRKAVLRRAAVLAGVPLTLAEVGKKAAQYSSGIQKLIA